MPSLNLAAWGLNQRAVYWAPLGAAMSGEQQYDSPIEIAVRWEDGYQQVINMNGEVQLAKAEVMSSTTVLPGFLANGVLWLGKLADLTDPINPFNNALASRIISVETAPTLSDDEEVISAYI
jgi:hypothetical protein